MCGIVGILSIEPRRKVDAVVLKEMSDRLVHRGPDNGSVWLEPDKGNIGFSFRRLAIIDLSEKGNQPLTNEDGRIHLVVNGEIYNFRELRKELILAGHRFKSRTDSEVIVHSYEEWGTKCLDKLDGMFAFLLWDSTRKLLFGARDRFGEKPLFYSKIDTQYVFASEVKAIAAHPRYRHFVNEKILRAYLAYNNLPSATPVTFYKGVYRILPAQAFTLSERGNFEKWFYWTLKLHDPPVFHSASEAVNELRSSFIASIKSRMYADVPVGSSLSGGLDSSSITCSVSNYVKRGRVFTFSARSDNPLYDEGPYIESVVEKIKSRHYEVYPSAENLVEDLGRFFYHLEEPYHEMTAYAAYCVFRLAHQNGLKVLIDGQGGDELLCGYIEDLWPYLHEVLITKGLVAFLKERKHIYAIHTEGTGGDVSFPQNFSLVNFMKLKFPLSKLAGLKGAITTRFWKSTLPLCEADRVHWKERFEDKKTSKFPLKRRAMQRLTNGEFARFLDYVDRTSMAHSVEVRLPFLHPGLVDFLISLDCSLKVGKGRTKYLLREAMKGTIPDKVYNRVDKKGFSIPQKQWLALLPDEWVESRIGHVSPYLLRQPQNEDELWRCLSASFVIEGFKKRS